MTEGVPGSHEPVVDVQFCAQLEALDLEIAARVQAGGCPRCGGRLDRADYARKPRGADVAPDAETWSKRFSLCCAREGCRRRCTPPSLRFLGRRVYAEVVVLVVCVRELAGRSPSTARAEAVPRRTARRWLGWWRTAFVASALWSSLRARIVPPPESSRLPTSLLERLGTSSPWLAAARLLSPLTTTSLSNGSRSLGLSM